MGAKQTIACAERERVACRQVSEPRHVVARTHGSRQQVLRGTARRSGKLRACNLQKDKRGHKIVSKKSEKASQQPWNKAVRRAREHLGCQGFVPIGGKTQRGKKLLAKARFFLAND